MGTGSDFDASAASEQPAPLAHLLWAGVKKSLPIQIAMSDIVVSGRLTKLSASYIEPDLPNITISG